jgi:CBS-domain-containing membrane protein
LRTRRESDQAFSLAYADRSAPAVRAYVDPIEARTRQRDLCIRRIDARHVVGVEHADADDQAALRDEQRELPVVESRHVEVGVAGEAELTAAVVHFGATIARHPNVVAGGHG